MGSSQSSGGSALRPVSAPRYPFAANKPRVGCISSWLGGQRSKFIQPSILIEHLLRAAQSSGLGGPGPLQGGRQGPRAGPAVWPRSG